MSKSPNRAHLPRHATLRSTRLLGCSEVGSGWTMASTCRYSFSQQALAPVCPSAKHRRPAAHCSALIKGHAHYKV